ncbi:hypothetical protein P154DRAFT_578877 [Amniculicola lignicola CBS 123094]|uniref:Uncharacterized protein n=1 Tax=Amniculicola lignicola CBS 123094 TaxID=1392246 RepID=A0A6A5WIF7_9PLEO|nr:hypothetical protein P154DRAFT_578877 [Amniculicola lignicola CBS 123094]
MAPKKPVDGSRKKPRCPPGPHTIAYHQKKTTARVVKSNRKHRNGMLNVSARGKYITTTKKNEQDSPLLRLPAEIRNTIYGYVLGGKTVTKEGWEGRMTDKDTFEISGRQSLALLGVCRMIYAETAFLPFTLNDFHFDYEEEISMLRASMRTFQWNAITTVVLFQSVSIYASIEPLAAMMKWFRGLKFIHLKFFKGYRDWTSSEADLAEVARSQLASAIEGRGVQIIVHHA